MGQRTSSTFLHLFRTSICSGKNHSRHDTSNGSRHSRPSSCSTSAGQASRIAAERPTIAWVNRTLSVSFARLGERLAALDSLAALQYYCPDLTIGRVMAALPFPRDFMERVAEGLDDLGLRP